MRADPRPREFLAALQAIPQSVRAVKKLYAIGQLDDDRKAVAMFVAPKRLQYRMTDASGRRSGFASDGKLSGDALARKLPPDAPRLVRLLADPGFFDKFGLRAEGDLPRQYEIEKRTENGVAVVALAYRGSDSIGRDQSGHLYLDARTGLLRGFGQSQSGNGPRDDGDFSVFENWTVLEVTR